MWKLKKKPIASILAAMVLLCGCSAPTMAPTAEPTATPTVAVDNLVWEVTDEGRLTVTGSMEG